jgi:hypothetical protein
MIKTIQLYISTLYSGFTHSARFILQKIKLQKYK